MRSRWRFTLGQLFAGTTGLAIVLAAALGHFGSVVQLIAWAILLIIGLALLRWLMEIGVEVAVYGTAFALGALFRVLAARFRPIWEMISGSRRRGASYTVPSPAESAAEEPDTP